MSIDEAEIIRRARRGDARARLGLVDMYQAMVFGIAGHMLNRREDVEEVFQTVFLRLFEHLDAIDPDRGVGGWLRRTVLNECFRRFETRSRRLEPVAYQELASPQASPDGLVKEQEARRALRRAIDALPPHERATVVLHYMEGLAYADVAEALGVSVETVRSRLKRARAQLRKRLQKYF